MKLQAFYYYTILIFIYAVLHIVGYHIYTRIYIYSHIVIYIVYTYHNIAFLVYIQSSSKLILMTANCSWSNIIFNDIKYQHQHHVKNYCVLRDTILLRIFPILPTCAIFPPREKTKPSFLPKYKNCSAKYLAIQQCSWSELWLLPYIKKNVT